MTIEIGTNLLFAVVAICATVVLWRALTPAIVEVMNRRPPDVGQRHHEPY